MILSINYRMFDNLKILCLHDSIIVNTNNGIIYNGGSHKFLTVTLDMSLNELSKDWLRLNIFEIDVGITWMMLQTRVSQAYYIGVAICSCKGVNSMFGFLRINEVNILGLYMNSRSRQENSYTMELTWFSSNSQRTI